MTNEEIRVLEEGISDARDAIQNSVEYARDCAKAFLDRIEKAQGNWRSTRKEFEELVRDIENAVRANEYCNARITAIEGIKEKLEEWTPIREN